jgi:hypothetical protein
VKADHGISEYNYSDRNPIFRKKIQYRIKQFGKTGNLDYSNIAVVTLGQNTFSANIFPNPAGNFASLAISNPAANKVKIVLYDVLGRIQNTLTFAEGTSYSVDLPVGKLQTGVYLVEIRAASNRKILKLFVRK